MKEVTVIVTCELTQVMKCEEVDVDTPDVISDTIKEVTGADDVKIKKMQTFVRDLT